MRSWKVQASHVRACAATGGGLWGPVASKWGHRDAGASYWTLCVWAQLPEGSTSYIYIYVSLYACSCCGSPCCSARKAEGWEYVGAVCLICVAGHIYRNMQCTFALCTCWEHILSLATGWIWGCRAPSSGWFSVTFPLSNCSFSHWKECNNTWSTEILVSEHGNKSDL